jgi:hypothetical protein
MIMTDDTFSIYLLKEDLDLKDLDVVERALEDIMRHSGVAAGIIYRPYELKIQGDSIFIRNGTEFPTFPNYKMYGQSPLDVLTAIEVKSTPHNRYLSVFN